MLIPKEIKGKVIRIRWKNINLDHPASEMYFLKYTDKNTVLVRFSSGVQGEVLREHIYFPDNNDPDNFIPEDKEKRIFNLTLNQIEAKQGGKLKKYETIHN